MPEYHYEQPLDEGKMKRMCSNFGDLKLDCDGKCGIYRECLKKTMEMSIKVEMHRKGD